MASRRQLMRAAAWRLYFAGSVPGTYDPETSSFIGGGDGWGGFSGIYYGTPYNPVASAGSPTYNTTPVADPWGGDDPIMDFSDGVSTVAYPSASDYTNLFLGTGEYTADIWYQSDDGSVPSGTFWSYYQDSDNYARLYYDETQGIQFDLYIAGVREIHIISFYLIEDTDWHYIALVRQETGYGLFIDTTQIGFDTTTTTLPDFAGQLVIGATEPLGTDNIDGYMVIYRGTATNVLSASDYSYSEALSIAPLAVLSLWPPYDSVGKSHGSEDTMWVMRANYSVAPTNDSTFIINCNFSGSSLTAFVQGTSTRLEAFGWMASGWNFITGTGFSTSMSWALCTEAADTILYSLKISRLSITEKKQIVPYSAGSVKYNPDGFAYHNGSFAQFLYNNDENPADTGRLYLAHSYDPVGNYFQTAIGPAGSGICSQGTADTDVYQTYSYVAWINHSTKSLMVSKVTMTTGAKVDYTVYTASSLTDIQRYADMAPTITVRGDALYVFVLGSGGIWEWRSADNGVTWQIYAQAEGTISTGALLTTHQRYRLQGGLAGTGHGLFAILDSSYANIQLISNHSGQYTVEATYPVGTEGAAIAGIRSTGIIYQYNSGTTHYATALREAYQVGAATIPNTPPAP